MQNDLHGLKEDYIVQWVKCLLGYYSDISQLKLTYLCVSFLLLCMLNNDDILDVYLASRHQVGAMQVSSLQTGLFRASVCFSLECSARSNLLFNAVPNMLTSQPVAADAADTGFTQAVITCHDCNKHSS